MAVKHFSEAERNRFVQQHPASKPKEWAVMDGLLVCRFYDTEEEAESAATKLNRGEELRDSERIHGVASTYKQKELKTQKYQFLRTAASIFRVLGWIALVAGIIGSIVGAAMTGGGTGALIAILGIIGSVVIWVFFLASRELLYLFMDVEENTRNTATLLERGESERRKGR